MYIYIYIYTCIYIYIYIYIERERERYICTHTYTYIYIYLSLYIYIYICIPLSLSMYIYIYIHRERERERDTCHTCNYTADPLRSRCEVHARGLPRAPTAAPAAYDRVALPRTALGLWILACLHFLWQMPDLLWFNTWLRLWIWEHETLDLEILRIEVVGTGRNPLHPRILHYLPLLKKVLR